MNQASVMIRLFSRIDKSHVPFKYLLVGAWNTCIGYGVFFLLDTLFTWLFTERYMAYMLALTFAQILGVTNAYFFHKLITFESNVKGRNMFLEFTRFSLISSVSFCINLILMPILVEVFDINPKISALLLVLIVALVSWIGHSKYSFNHYNSQKTY